MVEGAEIGREKATGHKMRLASCTAFHPAEMIQSKHIRVKNSCENIERDNSSDTTIQSRVTKADILRLAAFPLKNVHS